MVEASQTLQRAVSVAQGWEEGMNKRNLMGWGRILDWRPLGSEAKAFATWFGIISGFRRPTSKGGRYDVMGIARFAG